MLISEALELFIMDHESEGSSERTIKVYRQYVSYFIDFVTDKDLNDVGLQNITDYQKYLLNREAIGNKFNKNKNGKKLSRYTIKSYVAHVKALFNWCFGEKLICEKIFDGHKMVKTPKLIKEIMEEEEIELILFDFGESQLQLRNKCIFLLMVDSGLRVQEVINLNLDDFILTSNMLKICESKGLKDRFVPISLETKKSMYRYLNFYRPSPDSKDIKNFFLNVNKQPLTESAISSVLNRIKNRLGIKKLNPHYLRHTFATRYIINGGDMFSLQLIMGHEDIETTRGYVHLARQYTSMKYDELSTVDKIIKKSKLKKKKG